MTDMNEPDGEAIQESFTPEDVMPMIEDKTIRFGADPKLITTVKAWPPGKPPGGEIPAPLLSKAKPPPDKS